MMNEEKEEELVEVVFCKIYLANRLTYFHSHVKKTDILDGVLTINYDTLFEPNDFPANKTQVQHCYNLNTVTNWELWAEKMPLERAKQFSFKF